MKRIILLGIIDFIIKNTINISKDLNRWVRLNVYIITIILLLYYYYIIIIIYTKEKEKYLRLFPGKKMDRPSRFGPSVGFGIIITKMLIAANLRELEIYEARRRSPRRRRSSSLQLGLHGRPLILLLLVVPRPKAVRPQNNPRRLLFPHRFHAPREPRRRRSFLLQGPAGRRQSPRLLQIGRWVRQLPPPGRGSGGRVRRGG